MGKKAPALDAELLVETLSVQSKSHDDKEMMKWLKEKLTSLGLGFTEDSYGNVYVTKGKADLYPCMVSHTDTVHKILKDFGVYEAGDILFAFSESEGSQVGIGGDDKVGMSLCLNALKDLSAVKVVFFRNEEVGCLGSQQANMEFFNNVTCVLQADRKGNKDFITDAAGIGLSSFEFIEAIRTSLKNHQYTATRGSFTDVRALKVKGLNVCCANISCGYWEPHTEVEIVSVSDVEDCYMLMLEIYETCKGKAWSHTFVQPVFTTKAVKVTPTRLSDMGGEKDMYEISKDKDMRELALQFERENREPFLDRPIVGAMKHNLTPMVDLDDDEDYIEEIDICVGDMLAILDDYRRIREKVLAKQGRL